MIIVENDQGTVLGELDKFWDKSQTKIIIQKPALYDIRSPIGDISGYVFNIQQYQYKFNETILVFPVLTCTEKERNNIFFDLEIYTEYVDLELETTDEFIRKYIRYFYLG